MEYDDRGHTHTKAYDQRRIILRHKRRAQNWRRDENGHRIPNPDGTIEDRFKQDPDYRRSMEEQGWTDEAIGQMDEMVEAIDQFDEIKEKERSNGQV